MYKLFISILFLTCSILGSSQTNLLQNAGFETGNKGDHWYGWNWEITGNEVYEGSYAAETQTEYTGNAGIAQNVTLEVGKHYKLSCVTKTEKTDINAFLQVAQKIEGLNGWKGYRRLQMGNTEWTDYNLIFTIDQDTNKWRVNIWKDPGSGGLWSDNWQVVEVDPAEYSGENSVLVTALGEINAGNNKITKLLKGQNTVNDLLSGFALSDLATAEVFSYSEYKFMNGTTILTDDHYVKVFAENGAVNVYTLEFTNSVLLASAYGTIDPVKLSVKHVSSILNVAEFKSGLTAAEGAVVEIIDAPGGNPVANQENTLITSDMLIKVAGDFDFTEYTIEVETFSNEKDIVDSKLAVLDEVNLQLTIEDGVKTIQLLSSIEVSDFASFNVVDSDGNEVSGHTNVTDAMKVRVVAQNTSIKDYSIIVSGTVEVVEWENKKDTINVLLGKTINISGNSELHFQGSMDDMAGCLINIDSDSAFVFLHGIRPEDSTANFLASFTVSNEALSLFDLIKHKAALDNGTDIIPTNALLRQYYSGTVISPYFYAKNQPGVIGWSDYEFTGEFTNFPVGYRRGNAALIYNGDNIKSFCLKRGFMVMMAVAEETDKEVGQPNETELGIIPYYKVSYSRVFIASEKDYWINLEEELAGKVNYMVVVPWRWVSKKGVCTSNDFTSELNGSWWYSWWWAYNPQSYPEYVPMIKSGGMVKKNGEWDELLYVGNVPFKGSMTHFLGFNEPTGEDQGDITVDEAIVAWPRLLETGARLGSPAPKEGSNAHSWLRNFMSRAKDSSYRVDYICLHWYDWGGLGNDPDGDVQQIFNRFKSYLQEKYDTYKLPLWLTEFNANRNRNAEVQKEFLKLALPYLESLDYVERYSYFEPIGGHGSYFNEDSAYTEIGEIYRDRISNPAIGGSIFYGSNNLPDGIVYVPETPVDTAISVKKDRIKVAVYPNPVKGNVLYIKGHKQSKSVQAYNVLGNRIILPVNENNVDVSTLSKGIYVLIIDNEKIKIAKE